MKNEEMNVYTIKDSFDLETFQTTFNKWIKGFKEIIIDKEFNKGKGKSEIKKTDDKLSFRFTVKWGLDIERINGYVPPEIPEREEDDDEDEDDEELQKEKQYNKTHGVEITETFPFPILEEDQDTEGNK